MDYNKTHTATPELIDELVEDPPTHSVILKINPDMAGHFLDDMRNEANRRPKVSKIPEYAADMESDNWLLNGETIKISKEGKLLDGQNRMRACRKAEVPFRTHAVFGLDREILPRTDRGKPRNAADVLQFEGVPNATKVASALRWLMIMRATRKDGLFVDRGVSYTPAQVLEFYRNEVDKQLLQDAVAIGRKVCEARQYKNAGPITALYYLFAQIDQRQADRFFTHWRDNDRDASPLNDFMTLLKFALNGRVHETIQVGAIIKAWNIWRSTGKLPRLRKDQEYLKYALYQSPSDPVEDWR